MEEKSINVSLDTSGGVDFELLHLSKNKKKLYVSFVGGTNNGDKRRYPTFLRWKFTNFLDGDYLGVEDPLFKGFSGHCVMWYYGTEKVSYLRLLVPIIYKVIDEMKITAKDVTFIGSSGGGTASLYMANLMDGTTAFAMNPQYNLDDWKPFVNEYFKDTLKIDLSVEDPLGRNKIRLTNTKSLFFITENIASPNDKRQYSSFFARQGIPVTYGVKDHGNIVTWLYHAACNNPHSAFPDKVELAVLEFLRDEKHRGKNVDEFRSFSYLLGEQLSKRYELETKVSDLSACSVALMELLAASICQCSDLHIGNKELMSIDLLIPNINSIYYRIESKKSKFIFRIMTNNGSGYEKFIRSLNINNAKIYETEKYCSLRIIFKIFDYKNMCCNFIRETEDLVKIYSNEIPYYGCRQWVKTGWTGWAQINQGHCVSNDDVSEKLQYDLYYLKHRNIIWELGILVKAVFLALGGRHG